MSERIGRTLAQTFCLAFGITLVIVGALGFVVGGTSFETGDGVQGDELVIFEVNGWHNLVHIVSGLLLLAAAPTGPLSATAATAFGLVYALVTLWGFVDGDDVFGWISVNSADNFLHLGLTLAALFAGLTSRELMAQAPEHRQASRTRRRVS